MSVVLRAALLIAYVSVVVALTCGGARGQNDEVEGVVPDALFVDRECRRLEAIPATADSAQDSAAIQVACARFAADGNGDAWFATADPARRKVEAAQDANSTQHAFKIVAPRRLIPRDADTYVLLLAPQSAAWNDANMTDLRASFGDFGETIGPKNVAVWLSREDDPEKIDPARSRYYFDLLHLSERGKSAEGGPFIVTTSTRPDLWSSARDLIVIDLGGVSVEQGALLLDRLGAQMRAKVESAPGGLGLEGLAHRYDEAVAKKPGSLPDVSVVYVRGLSRSP